MKHASITFEIYPFDELPEEARNKAINDYVTFLMETSDISSPDCPPDLKRAVLQAEKMQTPWFTGSYIWDYCQEWILRDLRDPECFYLINGEVAVSGGGSVLPITGEMTFPDEVQS